MSIAAISGLIVGVVLIVLLLAGVPISISIGISSILAILPIATGFQRGSFDRRAKIVFGNISIYLDSDTVLYSSGKYNE